jgi:UDP-N-acetylmuramoylalanine--D-glutamate ligase
MDLAHKKIVVGGLGSSGVATAQFIRNRGAAVTATDMAGESEMSPEALQLSEFGVRLELGEHKLKTFETADLVVTSPGVPHESAPLAYARSQGVTVWGEMELASRFIQEPIVAITGTNGKTTTTTLVGEMLTHSGLKVFVGGNIGTPLIGYIDNQEKAQIVVVEVSSFQLDTIDRFRACVAVLLNIAEDHLDRYVDFDAYASSKFRIFENQRPNDIAIINGTDALINMMAERIVARRLSFLREVSTQSKNPLARAIITEDAIVFNIQGRDHELFGDHPNFGATGEAVIPFSAIKLFGRHNQENTAAAALATLAAGGNMQGIMAALAHFSGLPHRLEFITKIDGIQFYNDSKATNVDAVMRALESFSEPVVLLLGGRNKGGNFAILADSIQHRVKSLVLFGEAREEIKSALRGIVASVLAKSMPDAVSKARELAKAGEVVLFSPGCASFDMYENYARRGEDFRRCVEKLKKAA